MYLNQSTPKNKKFEIHQILRKLMRLSEITIKKKLGENRIKKILGYIENFAGEEIVAERYDNLKSIAKIRFSPTQKLLIKIVILIVGSVVYCNTVRIFTASFGSFEWPGAIIGGFVASVGVDYLATEASTTYVNRQVTRKALNMLKSQKSEELNSGENNLFSRCFWSTKIKYISSVEGEVFASSHEIKIARQKISIYVLFALVLNAIEFIGAFNLVNQLGLLDNLSLPIQLVISSLPVVVTWMFAYIQAEWFHRPEYIRQQLRKYQNKAEENDIGSIDRIYRELKRLDAGIEALLNRQSNYQTVELAELDAEKRSFDREIEELEEWGKVKLESFQHEAEQEKQDFAANYHSFNDSKLQDFTEYEVEQKRQEYEIKKSRAFAMKFQDIERNRKIAIDKFKGELQDKLHRLEGKRNLVQRKFETQKAQFEDDLTEDNQDSEDDLDNSSSFDPIGV